MRNFKTHLSISIKEKGIKIEENILMVDLGLWAGRLTRNW